MPGASPARCMGARPKLRAPPQGAAANRSVSRRLISLPRDVWIPSRALRFLLPFSDRFLYSFALPQISKVACRNYPNIVSPPWRGRLLSCSRALSLRLVYGSTYTTPTYSYSDVALVKLNRESIVSLFRSGRCYKLRQFIVSRAQSNLKDPSSGAKPGPQPDRVDDHPSSLAHNWFSCKHDF